jgi:hypothetical protein
MRPAWKPEEIEGDPDEWRAEIATLRTTIDGLEAVLGEAREVLDEFRYYRNEDDEHNDDMVIRVCRRIDVVLKRC